MGLLKKVVHVLSIICYVLIGAYALICLPMIFGCKPVVVLSGSMQPEFEVGSVVYYRQVPESELKVGDVISFQMNNNLVTHRIKSIDNGFYTTKGDNNNIEDKEKVTYGDIQGRVGGLKLPVIGHGVHFVNTHLYLSVIVVTILLAEFLLSNIKHDKISISDNKVKKGQNEK